jgi:hypothetical protein
MDITASVGTERLRDSLPQSERPATAAAVSLSPKAALVAIALSSLALWVVIWWAAISLASGSW